MAKKKSHTGFRNGKMFCFNCGGSQALPDETLLDVFAAMGKAFIKVHKDCPPNWKQPEAKEGMTIDQRMDFWLREGERGISSEAIFEVMSGRIISRHSHSGSHPWDPSDFYRCHKLLELIPEWREDLHKMREVSPTWAALVYNWDMLTELLKEQIAGKKNDMLKEMDKLRK